MGKTIEARPRKAGGGNQEQQQLDQVEEEDYGSESDGSGSSSSENSQSKSRKNVDELEDADDGGSHKSEGSGKFDILKNQWDSKTIKRNEKVIE